VCLRAKIERYPKDGEAPRLRGGAHGIGLDIDLAGPLDTSVDGPRYVFVGVERASGTIFAVPIGSKAEAMRVVKEALIKRRCDRVVPHYRNSALHHAAIHT
jgi:hypothetical protein